MDKTKEEPVDALNAAFSELGKEVSKNKLGGLVT